MFYDTPAASQDISSEICALRAEGAVMNTKTSFKELNLNNAFLFAASCYYSGYFWRRSYSTDLRIRFCIIKRLIKIIIRHNYSFKLNQVLLFKILELMLKPVAKLVKKH